MAEKTILVCDACGKPAAETVTMKTSRGNFVKDLCSDHVNELVAGARKPRPGRRKGTTVAGGRETRREGRDRRPETARPSPQEPRELTLRVPLVDAGLRTGDRALRGQAAEGLEHLRPARRGS